MLPLCRHAEVAFKSGDTWDFLLANGFSVLFTDIIALPLCDFGQHRFVTFIETGDASLRVCTRKSVTLWCFNIIDHGKTLNM